MSANKSRKITNKTTIDDNELIERYLEWHNPKSPRTVRQYRLFLHEFKRFLKGRGKTLSQILKEDLSAYVKNQREVVGNSSISIKPKYYNIRNLAKYLYFKDIITEKQYKEFLLDKYKVGKHKSSTKALTPEDISLVYKRISDPQLRMIFWVGETYGLRAEEYSNLRIQHIKLTGDDPYLEINDGKGDKDRDIAILEEDIDHWNTWLNIRSGYDLDHDYVFFTSRGKTSYTAIRRYYRKISELTYPLPEHLQKNMSDFTTKEREEYEVFKKKYWFTSHDLRRTFATIARTIKNVDLELIQNAMGHENVSTTQIYLREKDKTSRQRYRDQSRNNGNSD